MRARARVCKCCVQVLSVCSRVHRVPLSLIVSFFFSVRRRSQSGRGLDPLSMLQQNFHFIRGYKSRRVDFESAMAERRLDYLARWKSLERNRCLNSLREIQTSKRFNTHRTRCRFLSFRQSTSWGYNSLISPLGLSLRSGQLRYTSCYDTASLKSRNLNERLYSRK